MKKKDEKNEYELYEGLFGKTDRNSGEYYFKSGNTQQLYSNAAYIPIDDSTIPPRYYIPASTIEKKKAKKETFTGGIVLIICLCIICALLGGMSGALLMYNISMKSTEETYIQPAYTTESQGQAVASAAENILEENSLEDTSVPAKVIVTGNEDTESLTAKQLYAMACKQVVSINTEKYTSSINGDQIPSTISGTGFFVSDDGYILTNYHVVEQAHYNGYNVTVTTNDDIDYTASIVGYDEKNDIAILKISGFGFSAVSFGNSDTIEVGDDIYIIGNPYGVLDFTLTSGHVGGPTRQVDSSDNGETINMFQLDADIYDGNSGGPVYDSNGNVIGIVTAKFSTDSNGGIGFAIPINTATEIMTDILSNGYTLGKASAGIEYFEKYNDVMANFYGLPSGAYIMNVYPGSCAEKAGLERGDIIVQIGNKSVSSYYDCEEIISQYNAGDAEEFVIYRDRMSQYMYITVTFDEA